MDFFKDVPDAVLYKVVAIISLIISVWVHVFFGAQFLTAQALLTVLCLAYVTLRKDRAAPLSFSIPVPEQCDPEWKGVVLEHPSIKVSGSSAIQCYCPATGRSLGLVNPATPNGIDRAVAKAEDAQKEWRRTTFTERRKVLRTILKFVLENQETIAKVACLDSGKTLVDACFGELLVTAEKLKWTIHHGGGALWPQRRPTNMLMFYKTNEVRWEPLGVVAACVSWNYPLHNLFGPIISSLFAGNAIIVKASEQVAWSTQYFTRIIQTALSTCGHSPHLAQSLVCWPHVADHLTSHPSIAHLTFIGSRPVAHAVAASAATSLTPLVIELGGKDAAILLDDVGTDLNRIVQILMRGVFISAGQNCIGIERIIALPRVYPRLLAALEPLVRGLRVGSSVRGSGCSDTGGDDTIDVGACISAAGFARLEELIAEAVAQGARLLVGGTRLVHPHHPQGHYFAPTLLADVTPSMRIAKTELFAPVCVVMRAESVDDAITINNGTMYALGCSVFGKRRADLRAVVDRVQAGMVAVNDFGAYYMVQLPFGGVKGSGYGRFAGAEGLRGLCNLKSVCRDDFPGVKTVIPAPLRYPVKDSKRAFEVSSGVVLLGYAEGWKKLQGLRKVLGI